MIIALICVLAASLLANTALAFLALRRPADSKKPSYTYDAQAMLRDLMSGPLLLKVEYVDRSEVLLRSPRHM